MSEEPGGASPGAFSPGGTATAGSAPVVPPASFIPAEPDSFENVPKPAYRKPSREYGTAFGDQYHAESVPELLLAGSAYSQRGVPLAPGQGIVAAGTVLGRVAATGYYVPCSLSAGDGSQAACGVLRDARDTGASSSSPACLGNLIFKGTVNYLALSGPASALGGRVAVFAGGAGPFPGGPEDGGTGVTAFMF